MKQYLTNLKQFREERGLLTPNYQVTQTMALEELKEVLNAETWSHRIEEMCDVCIVIHNYLEQKGEQYTKDVHIDKSSKDVKSAVWFSIKCIEQDTLPWIIDNMRDCITLNGYDFDKSMLETTKKILSREGAMNHETGKWTKFEIQSNPYTTDYESCKL